MEVLESGPLLSFRTLFGRSLITLYYVTMSVRLFFCRMVKNADKKDSFQPEIQYYKATTVRLSLVCFTYDITLCYITFGEILKKKLY